MKLNRKWLMVIALVMSLTMATAGTLAYLTDRDTEVNTFTMGNVDIEVEENFQNNSPIRPGQTVNKDAEIKNQGTKDAWVWMTVSVNEGLEDYVKLNWTSNADEVSGPAVVDGKAIWTAFVNDKLAVGDTTGYILDSVELSPLVDYQGGKYVVVENGQITELDGIESGKLNVTVDGYAVQTDGIASVKEAYKAYAGQWGEDGALIPLATVTTLKNTDVLKNAEGDVIVLNEDLAIDTTDSKMGMSLGVINLDVAYQFEPTMKLDEAQESKYRYWHADFVVSVDKDVPPYGIGLAGYYDAWCSLNNNRWVMLAVNDTVPANEEIRLVKAMGGESLSVNYEELCRYGNDGIGFLCGAVALEGKKIDNINVESVKGTTLTVELRLYETEEPSQENGNSHNVETGNYITTGVYTYTFE